MQTNYFTPKKKMNTEDLILLFFGAIYPYLYIYKNELTLIAFTIANNNYMTTAVNTINTYKVCTCDQIAKKMKTKKTMSIFKILIGWLNTVYTHTTGT
jgi:hypothetical protein